jgi:hypothetical protein
MHGVSAVSEFVDCGWKWSSVRHALVSGIVVSSALATVAEGVNGPFSGSSSEPSGVLIVIISQWPSGGKGLAAVLSA